MSVPASLSAPTTMFAYTSDPQDFLGQGRSLSVTLQNATFRATVARAGGALQVFVQRTDVPSSEPTLFTSLVIVAPTDRALSPGSYDIVDLGTATAAGLSIGANGHGCNHVTGHMTVHAVAFSADLGTLKELRMSFEHHCEGNLPGMRGELALLADPWR
jgi:hypothetical protein